MLLKSLRQQLLQKVSALDHFIQYHFYIVCYMGSLQLIDLINSFTHIPTTSIHVPALTHFIRLLLTYSLSTSFLVSDFYLYPNSLSKMNYSLDKSESGEDKEGGDDSSNKSGDDHSGHDHDDHDGHDHDDHDHDDHDDHDHGTPQKPGPGQTGQSQNKAAYISPYIASTAAVSIVTSVVSVLF